MEITSAMLYWITRLDNIRILFGYSMLGSFIVIAVLSIIGTLEFISAEDTFNDEDERKCYDKAKNIFKTAIKTLLYVFLPLSLLFAFTPKTKEAAAIIVIPKIANSELTSEISGAANDVVKIAREWIYTLAPSNHVPAQVSSQISK